MRARLIRTALQKFLFKRPLLRFSEEQPIFPKTLRTAEEQTFAEMMYLERELVYCNNQQKIIDYVEKYKSWFNDEHIAQITQNIVDFQIQLDEEFNVKVAPVMAHYISLMDREHSRCFGHVLKNLALLEIKSPELWKPIVEVFYKERMVRYIPIDLLTEAFIFFDHWERPPYRLLNEIAPVIKKHRLRIPEEYQKLASETYEKVLNNKIEDRSFLNLEGSKVEQLDK